MMEPPKPDDHTIDAWLNGELSEEESELIEAYFSRVKPEDVGLRVAPSFREPLVSDDPDLQELLRTVKVQNHLESKTRRKDSWLEVITPSDDPDLIGTLGSYEILELIATGGMGIVLKARDPKLDRLAALKLLTPEASGNATVRERFLREARAAAKLEHENILPIYSIHDEEVPWFAMQYVSGGSLADALESDRKFTLDELKIIGWQVSSALKVAHENGIVHRDIKPANLLLDDGGKKVWVCDFGIARSFDDSSLTYGGMVAGTPQYMSPEQAAGTKVDGRSDLFSLGATLFHCATGKALHQTSREIILANLSSAAPLDTVEVKRSGHPAWFSRLLDGLLSKDLEDRFSSADEVVHIIDDENAPRPKFRQRRRRRHLVLAALALCVLLLSQAPFVIAGVNGLLMKSRGHGIAIEGRYGSYDLLNDVTRKVKDGDVILIYGEGPFAIDSVSVPRGIDLTIRAAAGGGRPVFQASTPGGRGITSINKLKVIGIDFEFVQADNGRSLIAVAHEGVLTLKDCHFGCDKRTDRYYGAKAILVWKGGELILENCRSTLPGIDLIGVSSEGRIELRNCDIEAARLISVVRSSSPQKTIWVTVSDSQFTGPILFEHRVKPVLTKVAIEVFRSELNIEALLGAFGTSKLDQVADFFKWTAHEVKISGSDEVAIGVYPTRDRASKILPVSDFSKRKP